MAKNWVFPKQAPRGHQDLKRALKAAELRMGIPMLTRHRSRPRVRPYQTAAFCIAPLL